MSEASKARGLRFTHLNINGLRNKTHEVEEMLNYRNSDILFISESRLTDDISNNQINIDGYNLLRKDRLNRLGGGLVIYHKSELKVNEYFDMKLEECDYISMKINLSKRKSANLLHIYRPPNCHIQSFLNSLDTVLGALETSHEPLFIIGDMNIDLLSPTASMQEYLKVLRSYSLHQAINQPTRITLTTSTLLDHMIINNLVGDYSVYVLTNSCSDHRGTEILWNAHIEINNQQHEYITYRCMKNYKQDEFQNDLSTTNWGPLHELNNIDEQLEYIEHKLRQAWDKHAPLKTIRVRKKASRKPWITKQIKKEMAKRDKIYKEFTESKSPDSWKAYKAARNHVSSLVRKNRYAYLSDKFKSDGDCKAIWKSVNNVLGRSKSSTVEPDPGALCNYFADVPHQTLLTIQNTDVSFHSFLGPAYNRNNEQLLHWSEADTLGLFRELNNSKAVGPDGFSNYILKQAGSSIVRPLTILFNSCLHNRKIPHKWKIASVLPIYKNKGLKQDTKNYRPISLLSPISKMYEKIISKAMLVHIESNSILSNTQHGFRPKASTTTATLTLIEDITRNMNAKQLTPLLLLDLSKAFDTVQHDIILSKLNHYGFSSQICDIIQDYLSQRSFFVTANDKETHSREATVGVPQGSVLGTSPIYPVHQRFPQLPGHMQDVTIC